MLKMLNREGKEITDITETESAFYVYIGNANDATDFILACNRNHDRAYGIDIDRTGWFMWDKWDGYDYDGQYVPTCAEAINENLRDYK